MFLHDDLLPQLLVRLPAKSLLRFRCVSKSWYSFISSPKFFNSYTRHNSKANCCFVLRIFKEWADKRVPYRLCKDSETLDNIIMIDFPFANQLNNFFRIVGCVNGLVCLSDDMDQESDTLILWNPAIGRFLTLPPPERNIVTPHTCQGVYGFGFHSLSNDYKVVRILYHENQDMEADELEASLAIFKLNKGGWEIIESVLLPLLDNRQSYVNGIIHWLAFKNFIMGFDAGNYKFRRIMLPKSLQKAQVSDLIIAPWCGFLSVFESGYWYGKICLWVMKSYAEKESWVKQFTIEPVPIVRSLRKNGNVILKNIGGVLVLYNQKTNKIEDSKIPIDGSMFGIHTNLIWL